MHPYLRNSLGLTLLVAVWAGLFVLWVAMASPQTRYNFFQYVEDLGYRINLMISHDSEVLPADILDPDISDGPIDPCDEEFVSLTYSIDASTQFRSANACLAAGTDVIQGYLVRGFASSRLGRYKNAQNDFAHVLELDNKNLNAHFHIGGALRLSGRRELALEAFTATLKLKPDFMEAYIERAWTLRDLNRYNEAIKDMDQVIRLSPRFLDAYMQRGKLKQKAKLLKGALADFEMAANLRVTNPEPRFMLGEVLVEAGKREAAKEQYLTSLKLAPGWPSPAIALAKLQIEDGDYKEAVDVLLATTQNSPEQSKVLRLRSSAYRNLGDFDKALDDANGAVNLSNSFVLDVLERGKVHEVRGGWDKAIADYSAVTNHTHSFLDAFEGAIRVHEASGDKEKADVARAAMHQAVLDPWHLMVHEAYMAFRNGQFSLAISTAEEIARKAPEDMHIQTALADILSGVGRIEESIDLHLRALTTGGHDRVAWYQETLSKLGYNPGNGRGVMTSMTRRALEDCVHDQCMLSY